MITKKYKAGDITITAGKGGGIAVEFDNPPTATNGNITEEQLATLQESDANYILFNNEIYDLMDKTHSEDTLTYSHVGYENNVHLIKTISITISTLAWVLNKSEVGEGGGLSRVDVLPELSKEELNKNLIYENNGQLSYMASITTKDNFKNNIPLSNKTSNIDGKRGGNAYYNNALYMFHFKRVWKIDLKSNSISILKEYSPESYEFSSGSTMYNNYLYYSPHKWDGIQSKLVAFDVNNRTETTYSIPSNSIKNGGCLCSNSTCVFLTGDSGDPRIIKFNVNNKTFEVMQITGDPIDSTAWSFMKCYATDKYLYLYGFYNPNMFIYKIDLFTSICQSVCTIAQAAPYDGSYVVDDQFMFLIGSSNHNIIKIDLLTKTSKVLLDLGDKYQYHSNSGGTGNTIYGAAVAANASQYFKLELGGLELLQWYDIPSTPRK